MPGQDAADAAKRLEAEYARDWRYFSSADTVEFEGRQVQGLALPAPVLRKIFRENAMRWVPGIATAAQPGK
jgi:hypothetical protein